MLNNTSMSALERLARLCSANGWELAVSDKGHYVSVINTEGISIGTIQNRAMKVYDEIHLPLSLLRDVTFLLAEVAFESYESRKQPTGGTIR